MYDCMLSTIDNPYNPFDDFHSWFMYDIEKGYNCCGKVARIAQVDNTMMQKEIDIEVEKAIDTIIQYDFANIYIKVTKELQEQPEEQV